VTTFAEPTSDTLHERHRRHHLAHGSLNHLEVFAQSLAATGPSIAIAGTIPVAYLIAGDGTVWSFVIGTVIVLLASHSVAQFARRAASTGSLATYAASGLGPTAGFTAAWALVLGYLGIAAATTTGAVIYGGAFLDSIGVTISGTGVTLLLLLLAAAIGAYFPFRGVRLSTRAAIIFEVASLIAIVAVLVVTLVHVGFSVDGAQLRAHGSTISDISVAAVLAAAAFVGFESSSSLGAEARHPFRAVPRAILLTVLGAGILYVISSYIQVLGYKSVTTPLAETSSPLNALAAQAGVSWLGSIVDLGIVVSALACTTASLNAASRLLFNLGREQVLPVRLGDAHHRHQTPHVALAILTPVIFLIPAVLVLVGADLLDIFGWVATAATFGYLLAYLLVLLAAPRYLKRIGQPSAAVRITSILGILGIAFVIYKNLVPVPAYPYSILPYVFLGLLLVGLAWYAVIRRRSDRDPASLGSLVVHAHEVADESSARDTVDLDAATAVDIGSLSESTQTVSAGPDGSSR